tara:strand:- start:5084 stop:5362 length:279 start_codon:yes stop_codon:yes gene_type:complete
MTTIIETDLDNATVTVEMLFTDLQYFIEKFSGFAERNLQERDFKAAIYWADRAKSLSDLTEKFEKRLEERAKEAKEETVQKVTERMLKLAGR